MDKQDLITFIAAIVLVLIIALIANPPSLGDWGLNITATWDDHPSKTTPGNQIPPAKPTTVESSAPPHRLHYNYNLDSIYVAGDHGYPVIHLPKSLSIYGGSDIFRPDVWNYRKTVLFAYMEENTSGYSEMFNFPYQVWRIKCNLTPGSQPQYAYLKWVLVNADSGRIITGGEIRHSGEYMQSVEISGNNMYLLISTEYTEKFTMLFETPEVYYLNTHIQQEMNNLIWFLNSMHGS